MACGILGLWPAPKNPQNVKVFFLPLSPFFSFLCAGVSYISQQVLVKATHRARQRRTRVVTSSCLDSHWNNLKSSQNKWSERIKHLTSKSPFFLHPSSFTLCPSFFVLVWTIKFLTVISFLEAFMSTSRFPWLILPWKSRLHVWNLCTFCLKWLLFAWQMRRVERRAERCSATFKLLSALLLQIQLFQTEAVTHCFASLYLAYSVIKPHFHCK